MSTTIAHYQVADLYVDTAALGLYRGSRRADGVLWKFQLPSSRHNDVTFPHYEFVEGSETKDIGVIVGEAALTQSVPGEDIPPNTPITALRLIREELGDGIDKDTWAEPKTVSKMMANRSDLDDMAENFVNLLRVKHQQYWLGFSGALVTPLGIVQTFDDSGSLMPFYHSHKLPYPRPVRPASVSSMTWALGIAEGVRMDRSGEVLLDGYFLVNELKRSDEALIYVAVSLEVQVKQTLTAVTPPELQRALDLVMKRRPSAISLYHEIMKVFAGRSLAEENLALYQRLESLVTDRNTLVHGTGRDKKATVLDHMNTAAEVRNWLLSFLGEAPVSSKTH